jgi:de-etiolated-1
MYESDLMKEFKVKKKKPLNLINNLIGRELGTYSGLLYLSSVRSEYSSKRELTSFNHLKRIYLCVTPNYSVLNVKIPNCYLRRFSPDGRYLIAFSSSLDGIQIFFFKSPSAGLEHIQKFKDSSSLDNKYSYDKTDCDNFESYTFRMRAFDVYLKKVSEIKLTESNELMNRECALFYKNVYLIVASSELLNDDNLPSYSQLATNNESIHSGMIENYTIYLVNIKQKKICDKLKFKGDKLNLAFNQSFGLFNNVFIVLSLQNQTIHVYNLVEDGETGCKFIHKQSIGRFCFNDDEELIQNLARKNFTSRILGQQRNVKINNHAVKGFTETCLTSMKQRFMSFLYREAYENNTLREFYLCVNNLINLKMEKLQLLDDTHLLIKYVNVEHMNNSQFVVKQNYSNINNRNAQTNQNSWNSTRQDTLLTDGSTPFYFVLYNIKAAKILNIAKNTSDKMLKILENFHDYFSLTTLDGSYSSCSRTDSSYYGNSFNFHTLPSNNSYSRQSLHQSLSNFNYNKNELTKTILFQLPISPQTFTSTPYLDHSLFSYDEKLISNMERAKAIGDQLIKFNVRDSGCSCFKLYTGRQNSANQQNSEYQPMKRLVTFIWHPSQPFCISIQRNSQEYNVNFHVYSKT